MPSGQSQTIWFSELKIILKDRWISNLAIEEQLNLLADLNRKLNQIRIDNNIQPAMMWCPNCKERHRSRFTEISITGLYFALKRFELCTEEEFKVLRNKWRKYSSDNKLDNNGKLRDNLIKENEIHKHDSTNS